MTNFANTQPRCPSCTICCSKAVSAKTMSLTIPSGTYTPSSGSTCTCSLLNTTYVFGTPTIYYPFSTNGQRLSICNWSLPFAWACTTTGTVVTSNADVCILYNGTNTTIGSYGCTGLDVFGSGLAPQHTRIGVVMRGSQVTGSALEFIDFWLLEYPSAIDCSVLSGSGVSIPFDTEPTLFTRRCTASGPVTVALN